MNIRASFDPSSLKRRLAARARGFKDNLLDEMNAAGRLISVSLATSAQPYGTGTDALRAGATAVRSDIKRIYATPSDVFAALSRSTGGPQAAKAFYAALGKGDFASCKRLIAASGANEFATAEIGHFDGGTLHKARRNKRGRIPATQKILIIVTNRAALRAYIDREVDSVGWGKAGWANCARTFKDKGATRGLPSWITRHKNAPASVAIRQAPDGSNVTVTMFNQVEYAENLLTDSDKSEAIGIGVDRLVKGQMRAEKQAASLS
jgi:hypothetical protein